MGQPSRPRFQPQNPAISGASRGWFLCTAFAGAMGVDKSTLGRKRPSGEDIAILTGDHTGGLTLPQVARVIETEYGVEVAVRTGANAIGPAMLAAQLRIGRGSVVQGNTGALLDGPHRSTYGSVNHAVWMNEGQGWHLRDGLWLPEEVLMYDPAADGHRSYVDQGPSWWSWNEAMDFAAALMPYGDDDPYRRRLGRGKVYAGVFPDTEPHVHLRYGGKRTHPFPDRTRGAADGRAIRSRPDRLERSDIVGGLDAHGLFTAYQVTETGAKVSGSRRWYGDHNGRRWVHESGLHHEGGST